MKIGVIPARMSSGRFPGKPMAPIHGMPMIGHCYHRSTRSRRLDEVVVATCDHEIFEYIEGIGGRAVMTDAGHEMCTDRVVEAVETLESDGGGPYDVVVNIQGDQPMVFPEMIDAIVDELERDPVLRCVSMMQRIQSRSEFDDPNRVKIVVGKNMNALYMSREPIPSFKKNDLFDRMPVYVHVALIGFRREFLGVFGSLEMTPLERAESVDYLRALENGIDVRMVVTEVPTDTVDTPEDLARVSTLMTEDVLMPEYHEDVRGGI